MSGGTATTCIETPDQFICGSESNWFKSTISFKFVSAFCLLNNTTLITQVLSSNRYNTLFKMMGNKTGDRLASIQAFNVLMACFRPGSVY
jgi:hypothetical protein